MSIRREITEYDGVYSRSAESPNGEKVVEFEEGDADFEERYKKSKWLDFPGWNKSKTGAISLQDHGAPVHYRNIKIKEL